MAQSTNRVHLLLLILATCALLAVAPASKYPKVEYKEPGSDVGAKLLLDAESRARKTRGTNSSILESPWTPVVFWHGMGDTAFGSIDVNRLALQAKYQNLTVLSVQIGDNPLEDELGGYFVNVNHQIDSVCKELLANEIIKAHEAFNAIGFSQGAQFLRGLIQRCPFKEHGIRVKNFISLGGQHQGVFGLPHCMGNNVFCDHIRSLLTHSAYLSSVQQNLVQAEYWHDPMRETEYKEKSAFLADINNEKRINQSYRDRLIDLDNMVLVQFMQDDMVVPRESSLFGFYKTNQTKVIEDFKSTSLYLEDRIGLKELNRGGRLHTVKVPGNHLMYKMSWFMKEIASVYLNN